MGYGLAAFICLLFIILAQPRGVLIALSVCVFIYLIVRRDFKILFILSISALVILVFSFYGYDLGNMLSFSYRLEMWESVLKQSLERPWFGHGFLHDSRVMASGVLFPHAHRIYVSIFFFSGVVGLILFGMMLLSALYYAYINRATDKFLFAGLAVVFASIALISDVGRVIVSPNDIWFYLWFPMGVLLASRPRK